MCCERCAEFDECSDRDVCCTNCEYYSEGQCILEEESYSSGEEEFY